MTVYLLDTEKITDADVSRVRETLPLRAEKADGFRFEKDRLLSYGAGMMLVDVLGLKDESLIRYAERGKPYVPGFPDFSISHSETTVAFAVDRETVGVDVEFMKEPSRALAERVCTPEELVWLSEDPAKRFYTVWTRKESLMKATGKGLGIDPPSFAAAPGNTVFHSGKSYWFDTVFLGNCALSVCASRPERIESEYPFG